MRASNEWDFLALQIEEKKTPNTQKLPPVINTYYSDEIFANQVDRRENRTPMVRNNITGD